MRYPTVQRFLPAIKQLQNRSFTKQDLLTESFLIENDNDLDMYFAPHNEYINKKAKIVIVGITPGWNQMKIAFEKFIQKYKTSQSIESSLYQAKIAAGFAGPMRMNLIDMLDQCEIPKALQISSSADLFNKKRHLLHTTSVIKYPVFVKGKNYTGHNPPVDHSFLLQHYAYQVFPEEIIQIPPAALVVPLGKTVEQVLFKLMQTQKIPNHEYLTGFPHPSGANGHRKKQFYHQKNQLCKKIKLWSARKNKNR